MWVHLGGKAHAAPSVTAAATAAWSVVVEHAELPAFLHSPQGSKPPLSLEAYEQHFRGTLISQMVRDYFLREQAGFDVTIARECAGSVGTAFATGAGRALARTWLIDVALAGGGFEIRDDLRLRDPSRHERHLLVRMAEDRGIPMRPDFDPQDAATVGAVLERRFTHKFGEGHNELDLQNCRPQVELLRLVTGREVRAVFRQVEPEGFPFASSSSATWTAKEPRATPVFQDVDGGTFATLDASARRLSRSGQLALRRYAIAVERSDPFDQLIDFWVGLEALFLPDGQAELSFRAAIRIAAFLGETGEQRVELQNFVKRSYGLRSKIVHGSLKHTAEADAEVRESAQETGHLLRRALLKVLAAPEQFSPSKIEEELLSGTVPTARVATTTTS
jgi:hypothetical protein